jgi:DNA polymerase-4
MRPVDPTEEIKSISCRITFDDDTNDLVEIQRHMKQMAEELEKRLEEIHMQAYTVHVMIRLPDFSSLSRQKTLHFPIKKAGDIQRNGILLLQQHHLLTHPLRLIGLGISKLEDQTQAQMLIPLF